MKVEIGICYDGNLNSRIQEKRLCLDKFGVPVAPI
jgi:hypothetical protein